MLQARPPNQIQSGPRLNRLVHIVGFYAARLVGCHETRCRVLIARIVQWPKSLQFVCREVGSVRLRRRCSTPREDNPGKGAQVSGCSSYAFLLPTNVFSRRISELENRLRVYELLDPEKDGAITSSPRHIGQIYDYLPESHRPEDDMSQLLRGVNFLTISTRTPEFYGGSSSNAIISAVEAPKQTSQTQNSSARPDFPAQQWIHTSPNLHFANASGSSLPPRSVADDYVNLYFQTAHRIYPILNQKTFMERYQNFWEGLPTEGRGYELWIAVMYMVLAHGHQCSLVDPDTEVRQAALNSNHGDVCFNLAKAALTDVSFTSGDMSSVNSLFLGVSGIYNWTTDC